ncbi:hypothetical protein C2E23DRAFT_602807 [Lenzites betulinus]|nr:hypothetical protein C2E23DRAFT_602807 [Lenzites betulinus]
MVLANFAPLSPLCIVFIALFTIPRPVQAANDWAKPCFDGQCSWDLISSIASGTLQIAGPPDAVSDITAAAGWMIMDCDSEGTDQDIRLVCQDPDKGCDHLYTNRAAGTLVRLPDNCGSIPFALITHEWVHEDQSLPADKVSSIDTSGYDAKPVVKGLSLTTDFNSNDIQTNGNVTFFLVGSSLPGVAMNFPVEPPTASAMSDQVLTNWVYNSLHKLAQLHSEPDIHIKNITGNFPINFDKETTIFHKSMDCPQKGTIPAFSGSTEVVFDGKSVGNVSYGVVVAGNISPHDMRNFTMFVSLNATITGTLSLNSTLTGTISSPKIKVVPQVIFPALVFPPFLTIGPTFTVNLEATASLDANINADVALAYNMPDMQFYFPSSPNSQSGQFKRGDSNIKLSVSPEVASHGQIAVHLIPELGFGISAFDDKTETTITLDLDASVSVNLDLVATADAACINGKPARTASFGGCVDITGELAVNASADADLFDVFQKGKSVQLFQRNFDLYKDCFGDNSPARRADTSAGLSAHAAPPTHGNSAVTCPGSHLAAPVNIVQKKVSGLSDVLHTHNHLRQLVTGNRHRVLW